MAKSSNSQSFSVESGFYNSDKNYRVNDSTIGAEEHRVRSQNSKFEPSIHSIVQLPTVELIKPIEESENTTEFLMLTLQRAFNYEPPHVQELITNQNQYLFQACDKGIKGDYEPIIAWFRLLINHIQVMVKLFRLAYARYSVVEVNLILNSVRCGFFSQNEAVCYLALEVVERTADLLFENGYEFGLQAKKLKNNKTSIVEVKVAVFQQLQDWFINSRKTPQQQQSPYKLRNRHLVRNLQTSDPNNILRIICLELLETHPSLASQVARLIHAMFREIPEPGLPPSFTLTKLPEKLSEVLFDDIFVVYSSLSLIIPELRKMDRGAVQHLLMDSNLVFDIIAHASEQETDNAVRLQCTTLLIDLWYDEGVLLSNIPPKSEDKMVDVSVSFYEIIRSGLVHQDKVYRITVFGAAFGLFEHILEIKSAESPELLKTMISAMIELMKDTSGRKDRLTEEFLFRNFLDLFEQHPELPLNVLVEPVIQVLNERVKDQRIKLSSAAKPGNLSSEELNFLIRISKHPRLPQNTAFILLELMATVYIAKPFIALTLLPVIRDLVQNFKQNDKLIGFTSTIVITKALSSIISLKKQELTKVPNTLSQPILAITQAQNGGTDAIKQNRALFQVQQQTQYRQKHAQVKIKLQRYEMAQLVVELYMLDIPIVQQNVKEQIKVLVERYQAQYKEKSSVYKYLVSHLNLYPEESEFIQDNYGEYEQSPFNKQLVEKVESTPEQDRKKIEEKHKERMITWSKAKEPKNEIALRAIEEMNEIKRQRLQKQQDARIEDLKKKDKEDRLAEQSAADLQIAKLIQDKEALQRKQIFRDVLQSDQSSSERTNIKLLDPFHDYILKSPVLNQTEIKTKVALSHQDLQLLLQFSTVGKDGLNLVNFELLEEDRERDAMSLLVYRNQQLFSNWFTKYAQTSQQSQINLKRKSLEQPLKPLEKTITSIEIQKFFRDHNVDQTQLSSKELMVLIKMINDFFLLRLGTTSLDYTGFVQLVIQTAIHVHRKGRISGISPKDAFKMMYSDMVLSHFKQYREQAWKRGEDWDFIANDAKQKTNGKQGSDQIDSQEPVQSIKTQIFQNKIPDQVRMVLGEAKCAALEIINDRVMRLFDFSILPSVAVEKLSSKKHTRNRSSMRIESAKMIEQKKTDQRKVNRVNEQNSQQSSEKQKQEPDYPIYTAANLAKRISYFNPINEKRNVRRDKENEQLLMVLPMSPALKVACFELQQVQPQIRMEDYRDVSLCLELVLQSVAGFQTYPGSLSVKPPQQVRKRIVLDPVQQAGTPKIPVKLGIRELKKQQQELEELEKKKRNEEFLKRGLKLKEQLTSDQEMKELLAQRAKNVKNVRLLSVQKYHDRLQQAQPQQSRNGDNRRMQDSQSQNVLNRNNSNRDLDNVSHSKRLKNPASYSTLDINRRDHPKNSSQADRNTYVSNGNSDRNGKKNYKNQQGPNTYGDRGLKNGGQDDGGFGSNGDHGRNYGNQNDDRQGSDRDRERNYGGQNYDSYGSNGDRGRNYGDKNEDREDPNGDRYRNDGSLNYEKYGPNGNHERNNEGPNDSRQGLNRDRDRNQGELIDIPYGYDAINDRRRNNGGPPEELFNKNSQRAQNGKNPDNLDFRGNQNGINSGNRDVRGSQNGINPDNRDVRGSQNGITPDNRDVKGIQMRKNPDNQVKIGSQDGSNVDDRGREGKDNISQNKKEVRNLEGQKRKEGTNPDGLNSKDNKPPIEKQKDHLETISKRKPINVTLKLNEEQKTALTEFYGQKDVSALYAEVEDKLRKIFKHHSHMVSVSMGNNIQIEVVRMTKPGWKIICKEREIEAEKLFSQMAQVKTGVEASISFDEMKKLLIIIAVVGKVDPADKNSLWSINKKNDATVAFYKQDLNTTLIKKEPALKQFLTLFSQEPKGSEVKNLQIADDSGESFAEKASVDGDFNDYKLD